MKKINVLLCGSNPNNVTAFIFDYSGLSAFSSKVGCGIFSGLFGFSNNHSSIDLSIKLTAGCWFTSHTKIKVEMIYNYYENISKMEKSQ